jgi:hypothetical protein
MNRTRDLSAYGAVPPRRHGSRMYTDIHVKYPLLLSEFNETWIFSTDLKKFQTNFMKIRHVGAEFFHADGRTDRLDESDSGFSQFWRRRIKTTRMRLMKTFRSMTDRVYDIGPIRL